MSAEERQNGKVSDVSRVFQSPHEKRPFVALCSEMDSFRLLLNNHKKPLPAQMCITGCLAEQGLNGSLVDVDCL